MQFIKYFGAIIINIVLLASSCSPVHTIQQGSIQPMPESFDTTYDAANSANMNWRQFFNDKNLITLIDTALKNNWDVMMALQRIKAAQSDVLLSKGALKPMVSGSAGAGISKFGLYTMDGAGNTTTEIYNGKTVPTHLPDYFIGLQTAWELDIWGKLRNKRQAAAARLLASTEGRNLVVTNLITEISIAYYELLALDNQLDIIDETIALQENAFKIVKVQKEAAAANELAVRQFEAQLLNLRSMKKEVLYQIAENENKINSLCGRLPQPIVRDKSSLIQFVPPQFMVGIPSALLQNRPDIRQAELELIASKADVRAARSAFYPTVNIDGSLGFQAFKTGLLLASPESVAYSLLGNLTAPLINRSAIKAEFKKANANQLEALYNYQKTIMNGYIEVNNEVQRVKKLEDIFDLKTKEASVLSKNIETASLLFKTGRANYLEVLITQQNALQAKLELMNTKKDQFISVVNVYKALGGGWRS